MSGCLGQSALDVGENAKILFGASPQSRHLLSPSSNARYKLLPRRLDRAALEIESRQCIERLRGEHIVADFGGDSRWLRSQSSRASFRSFR